MTRDEAVQAGLQAIEDGQKEVVSGQLGAAYDAGEAVGTGPGFTQADLDKAVADAVAPLNTQIAQDATDLAAAHAKADADLAAVQASLDAMTAKEQLEEAAVADVAAKIASVQASFDAIKALLAP